MRKVISMVVVLVVLTSLILVACTTTEPTTPTTPTAPTTPSQPQTPAKPIELSFSYGNNPGTYQETLIYIPFKERVEAATNGKVKIVLYPSGTLVSIKDAHDGCVAGICDITDTMAAMAPGRYPLIDIAAMSGLGVTDTVMGAELMYHLCQKFPQIDKEQTGTKVLWRRTTSLDMIGTKKVPVRKLEDLKGLKLRTAGASATKHFAAMGAVPQIIGPTDIYPNMEKGVLDGYNHFWSSVLSQKLHEVTNYYTESRLWMGSFFTLINQDKWDSLPSEIQDTISGIVCNIDWWKEVGEEMEAYDKQLREQVKKEDKDAEFIELSPEERARWAKVAEPIWEEYVSELEAKGLPGRAVLTEIQKFVSEYKR